MQQMEYLGVMFGVCALACIGDGLYDKEEDCNMLVIVIRYTRLDLIWKM